MPLMNFDLMDGKPKVSFTLKQEDVDRFMQFMNECSECQKQRDTAWLELKNIRAVIAANPEESTFDEVEKLKGLSVTNIIVNIVPGFDGMGEEVYAKSVEEIEQLFSDLSQESETIKEQRAGLLFAMKLLRKFKFCDGNADHLTIIDTAISRAEI